MDLTAGLLDFVEPQWLRALIVSLVVVALFRWSRELQAAFSPHPLGASVVQTGSSGKVEDPVPSSTLPPKLPVEPRTNRKAEPLVLNEETTKTPIPSLHSDASGMYYSVNEVETKRAVCGLMPGSTPITVETFGRALQRMILSCRDASQGLRLRFFDDHDVSDKMGSHTLKLTECRCTQFRSLRRASALSEEDYIESMCARPFSGGKIEAAGKSGSFFLRTWDNKFVLKTIEEHEFFVLKDELLPHLVGYLHEHVDSLICRFVAAYSLQIGDKTLRFIVMPNVLVHETLEVYDLKGTTEDRWVNPDSGGVLKDNNFANQRILFPADFSSRLNEQIRDDAEFLLSLGVMDYSLLVGICKANDRIVANASGELSMAKGWLDRSGRQEQHVFQMGIIDYLQKWTPKKVAAHWIKKTTLGCFHEIDTEPPEVYCKRFHKYLKCKIQAPQGR
jgi:hypothetical protein